MNNKNIIDKREKEKGKTSRGSRLERGDSFRVVITREANMLLEQMVAEICKGFGCDITKSDVANYVFSNLQKLLSESDIKLIRGLHFDDKKVLGTLLKGEDDLPDDLRRALRAHYGLSEKEKKRTVRAQSELSTESAVDNPSADTSIL